MNLKLLQWNIGGSKIKGKDDGDSFFSNDGIFHVSQILQESRADVVCFQELHLSKKEDQLSLYSQKLGHRHKSFVALEPVSHLDKDSSWGIGVSSKFPILSTYVNIFKNPNVTHSPKAGVTYFTFNYGLLTIEILVGKNVYRIGCLHSLPFHLFNLGLSSKEAKKVFYSVNHALQTNLDVLSGDFNIPNGVPEEYILKLKDYSKVVLGKDTTVSQTKPDCVFYSDRVICRSSGVLTKNIQTDHFPVIANLNLLQG